MNRKILIIVIVVVVVALAIPFAIYTISPLFVSNTVNEPLPTTAAVVSKKAASQEYQKFVSMNEQDRINAVKQMNQRQKNVVMIGAAQINNTMNENVVTSQGTIDKPQTNTTNAITNVSTAITGPFIGAVLLQNYNIPVGTDLAKYNMALIWCKDFSVLFGSAQLKR